MYDCQFLLTYGGVSRLSCHVSKEELDVGYYMGDAVALVDKRSAVCRDVGDLLPRYIDTNEHWKESGT